MKARDLIQLFEYGKAFSKTPKEKKAKKDFTFKDYVKFEKEMEEFLKWQKEQEKAAKEKEKKAPPPVDFGKIAMVLVASFPIIGPLYLLWIMSLMQNVLASLPKVH